MAKEVPYGPRMFQFFIEDQSLQTHSKYKYILVLLFLHYQLTVTRYRVSNLNYKDWNPPVIESKNAS